MPEATFTLAGRKMLVLDEGTVQHDIFLTALLKRSGVGNVVKNPDEDPLDYAHRLIDEALASGLILEILGGLLIPEDLLHGQDPIDVWTPQIAQQTTAFLGSLRERADKDQIRGLVLTALVGFIRGGAVSLMSFATSSATTTPPPPAAPNLP